MRDCKIISKRALTNIIKGYTRMLLSFIVTGISKRRILKSLFLFFTFVLLMFPLESFAKSVSSEPSADQRIYIYDQGWSGAHKHGGNIQIYHKGQWKSLNSSGCGFYVYLHAYQWLTGDTVTTSSAESLILRMKDEISKLAGKAEWDCRDDQYYENYFKGFGIKRSNPSMSTKSLESHFAAGGVVKAYTPDGGSHFNLAVGIANGDIDNDGKSEYWVHIVDSSAYSTLSAVEKVGYTNCCYSFTNHSALSYSKLKPSNPKVTNNRSEDNGVALEYWIRYDVYAKFTIRAGYLPGSKSNISTTLEFQNVTYPNNYKVGTSGGYPLSGGVLVSNEELKSITTTIKKSDGTVISGPTTRNISGKTYAIKSLDTFEGGDNGVKFSKITQAGNYVWVLTATDAKRSLTLEMPFNASSSAITSHNVSKAYVPVTNVSLDKSNETLTVGDMAILSATVSPDNASNKGVSWRSDNTAVATVDGTGKVTAVSPGTATITVTTADGGKAATCLVTVPANENLSLSDRIRIAILNNAGYNPELDLNNDGKVNAQDYILAKKAELEPATVPVTDIVWGNMEFKPGETGNAQYSIYPKNATNQSVYCDPYENEVCTVSVDGTIYAKSNGYSYVCIHSAEDPNICVWGIICVHDSIHYSYESTVEPSGVIDIHFTAAQNDKDKLSGFQLYQNNDNTHFLMQKSIIPGYNGPELQEIQDDDWGSGQIFVVETNPRDNLIRADQEITFRLLPDNMDELWGTQQTYSFFLLPYYEYGWENPYEKGKVDLSITVSFPEKDTPRSGIEQFVYRCYDIILGRQPDAGGMDTWVNELNSGRKAASEIIDNFVRSQEFLGKNYSNADAVEILYKAMLGRGSDPAGKADWVGKLDAGYPFAVVINGFCGSKEFKEICDNYGIAPGSVSMEQESVSDQQIRAFVTRCYKIILGRDADEVGMNTWFNELKSRRRTAAEIIEQFVYSQEFQNKKYSNPDAVEILYKAMLGRGSDPAGKADWVGRLAGGQPLTAIINGFCGSMEFTAICEAYGITPGSVKVENLSRAAEGPAENAVPKTEKKANLIEITNASDTVNENLGTAVQAIYINEEKAKEFIGRCYRVILGREAGAEELNGWIGQMMNGSKTADQIARGFLFSGEFKGRNIGNEELVKILYRVYMNREADPEGLATWTQKLDEGTSLNDLLDIFSKTNEFKAVIKNMAQ